jgi:hypothetical protein
VSPEVESLARIAGILAVVLAAAMAAQWPLQRLRQRLPLLLTRQAMGGHAPIQIPRSSTSSPCSCCR